MTPGPAPTNDFGLKQTNHGFGECVVARIDAIPDRRRDLGIRETIGVAHREILRARSL
jgi:hypothetical protein